MMGELRMMGSGAADGPGSSLLNRKARPPRHSARHLPSRGFRHLGWFLRARGSIRHADMHFSSE
jgi:hypothetical protein